MRTEDVDPERERHARLCAYLFGELGEAGRREVERELAASAELRAEKERLERTIALARAAPPRPDALPPAARAVIAAAAARAGGEPVDAGARPWPLRLVRGPLVGLAVAATLLAIAGAGAWLAGPGAEDGPPVRVASSREAPARPYRQRERASNELAKLQRAEADAPRPRLGVELDRASEASNDGVALDSTAVAADEGRDAAPFTYRVFGDDGAAAAPPPQAEPRPATEGASVGKYRGPGDSAPPDASADSTERLSGLGYLGGGSAAGGSERGRFGGRLAKASSEVVVPEQALDAYDFGETAASGEPDFASDSPFDSEAFSDVLSGSDRWFLGHGGNLPSRRISAPAGAGSPGPGPYEPALGGGDPRPADVDALCRQIVARCRVRPGETPDAMFFRCWGENPFELAREDPLSTFAADVDTASWPLVRSYLARGLVPPKEAVRTEEMVNWFDSGVAAPREGTFGIALEMAPHPFPEGHPGRWLLRVVVRGREVDRLERQDVALTFVVDTSGSMRREDRLGLVQHALRLLAGQLGPSDRIAIVAFSNTARVVLPSTSAADRTRVEQAVESLEASGSTNAAEGLRLGYEVAAAGLAPHAVNRVVLLSDGVANVGATTHEAILAQVEEQRAKGIYLNTVGVGFGNHSDVLLEQLADRGDGVCTYVDGPEEARRALVDRFTGALQPIARDVKIQVELDPAQVHAYRLLGYENRAVADRDFRNDAVDAGELNAGHQVAAIYEVDPLHSLEGGEAPLATVRVRWKDPFPVDRGELSREAREAAEEAHEVATAIAPRDVRPDFRGASYGFQRQVLVAELAEMLRRSVHVRDDSLDRLVAEARRVAREDGAADTGALADLLEASQELLRRALPNDDELVRAIDDLCRLHYQRARLELLGDEREEVDADLEQRTRDLERELEDRIRHLLEARAGR